MKYNLLEIVNNNSIPNLICFSNFKNTHVRGDWWGIVFLTFTPKYKCRSVQLYYFNG